MLFGAHTHHQGPQHVVHRAHHKGSPQAEEQGFPPGPRNGEGNHDRDPDQRRPQHWNDGCKPSHGAPQHGRADSGYPEAQGNEKPLPQGDRQNSIDGRGHGVFHRLKQCGDDVLLQGNHRFKSRQPLCPSQEKEVEEDGGEYGPDCEAGQAPERASHVVEQFSRDRLQAIHETLLNRLLIQRHARRQRIHNVIGAAGYQGRPATFFE